MTVPEELIAEMQRLLEKAPCYPYTLLPSEMRALLDYLSDAREKAHYATGTADLAMKHRDEAEAARAAISPPIDAGWQKPNWMIKDAGRYSTHSEALDDICAAARLSTLSYDEAIAIYLRARGILRDDAGVMADPVPSNFAPHPAPIDGRGEAVAVLLKALSHHGPIAWLTRGIKPDCDPLPETFHPSHVGKLKISYEGGPENRLWWSEAFPVYTHPAPAPGPADEQGRIVSPKNVAELEALLASDEDGIPVEVLPDGSIRPIARETKAMKIEVCKGQAGLALYVDDTRVAGPRHNGMMETVLSATIDAPSPADAVSEAEAILEKALRRARAVIATNVELEKNGVGVSATKPALTQIDKALEAAQRARK